jgi:hypothetical protein
MRISCQKDDPDYVPMPELAGIQVFLDGVEQSPHTNGRGVIVADEEAGEIVFHEMVDGDQPYRPFKISGDKIATFTARGIVKISRSGRVDFGQLTRF